MRLRHKHFTPGAPAPLPPDPQPMFEGLDCFTGQMYKPPSVSVDTSVEAAVRIEPHTMRLRSQVYAYIVTHGGATEREIEQGLGLPGNSTRPRLWELCGNAPAGQPKPRAVIEMTQERRDGCRVYQAL